MGANTDDMTERSFGANDSIKDSMPKVYEELRGLARAFLSSERDDLTLRATGLVHEAYLRLAAGTDPVINDEGHFFRLAAVTMRRILVDHARKRMASKRGQGGQRRSLSDTALLFDEQKVEILEIDDAMRELSTLYPEKARVVELRVFGGCTIEQTAAALGISTATVERHWRFARAWLIAQLSHED